MSPTNSNNHYGRPDEEMFLNNPAAGRRNDGDESPIVGPLRIHKPQSSGTAATPQSATAAALPYPDDRPRQQKSQSPSSQHAPYPEPNSRIASPAQSASSADYPAALRPRDGRESKPSLAERRGNAPPKPLPESPGPETPDKDALFQAFPPPAARPPAGEPSNAQPSQHYFPPPTSATAAQARLKASNPHSINRISSTASNSTTRAQRGSPPPPETPIVGPGQRPGADIEARFAAAGIAGTSTLSSLQARNAAAQQRAAQYAGQQESQRPWTPTEQPGTEPHGPPTVYQGDSEVGAQQFPPPVPSQPIPQQQAPPHSQPERHAIPPNALEQDFQRMNLSSSPPPAYSTVPGANAGQSYPNEKGRPAGVSSPPPQGHPASSSAASIAGSAVGAASAAGIAPIGSPAPSVQSHPAFANDLRQQPQQIPQSQTPVQQQPQQQYQQQPPQQILSPQQSHPGSVINEQSIPSVASPAPSAFPPASPPPLPEGWIAHLDTNSGQYYYIHLPTQSTQWEFPKGPTPLNLNDTPLSPVGSIYSAHPLTSPAYSTFGGKPLGSPGVPLTPMYEGSVMGLSTVGTAVTGPPPSSGVELYKVAATNGVYFGPYLRYCNMDLERGIWYGSILLVTDAPQPPTIHIHQSVDLSPNPRQLKGANIAQHQRWVFYKYDIDLQMDEAGPAKWTYAITSHLGCTRYEFLVAGRHETNWRFIATSGNDFSLNVNANERARLGGVGFMWKDIMQKYAEVGGFHCQLGLGGQISADRIWKEIPLLKQWLGIHGKEQRKNAPWTAAHEEEVSHAYFHYYTSHFDQPHLREAFAQIPHILQLDDHDIFDGFGSYPQHMQFSNVFKNIGRIGIEMYLLFQHHTTVELLRNMSTDHDLFTITGTGWHFVKYLGPAVVVVGPDCRSERNPHQVMAGPTYQGLFPKVALLPPSVQHCIWLSSVPLIYPRLDSTEQIANAVATGKKAVTGAYNLLGKVTSSVAGVVGAKDAVGSGFDAVKRAVGKNGLMGSVLNPFGEIDLVDEFRDQWTHDSKDLERTYLIRTLQGIAKQKSLRITFLSGAVNLCGAGIVHDPSHPSDHKTMYQLISSPVVNTPPSGYILKLLHNNKPLYLPANGQRSNHSQPSDTKEDMLELFQTDVNGQPREYRRLMGRRNYVAIVAYDPEVVAGTFGQTDMNRGAGKLSLAADFMVQGEGAYGSVVKYGMTLLR